MKKMKSVPLNEEIYNYILSLFVPEDELLEQLLKETEKLNIPLIQISPEQGRMLYLICKMIKASKALEIGTLTGYSGIHIAGALTQGGKLITVEKVRAHAEIARKYFILSSLENKAEVVIADALDYTNKLVKQNEKFDLIFIDADKINYPEYFKAAIKLSHPGTVIAFDNTIKDGKIIEKNTKDEDLKAIQMTNELMSIKNDQLIESILLPIGDGLTIGIVR
jgi:caffeoyl-CoA O-methyltransferase